MYQYRFVSVPKTILKIDDMSLGETLVEYLAKVVGENTDDEWEYYRTDNYSVLEEPGCLLAFFWCKSPNVEFQCLSF